MKGSPDHLLRTALRALVAYAPEEYPRMAGSAEICDGCGEVPIAGIHKPLCRWMRARSVIGAIRSYQRGNR